MTTVAAQRVPARREGVPALPTFQRKALFFRALFYIEIKVDRANDIDRKNV